jgi:hypothetical protein
MFIFYFLIKIKTKILKIKIPNKITLNPLLIDNKSIKLILINKLSIKTITTIIINKITKSTIKKYLNYKNNIKLSNKLIRYENKNIKIINNEKIIFKSLFEN